MAKIVKKKKVKRSPRVPKGARVMHRRDGDYYFKVGKGGGLVVWTPYGEKHYGTPHEVLGLEQHVIENLLDNDGLWIFPADVAEFIERDFKPRVVEE